MNFCAVDWNELIKLFTPFFITLIVYYVWHKQKGKEVIASEAKSLLKNLLEEAAHISALKYENSISSEILSEKIERINIISQDNYRCILYLESCLNEPDLLELFKNYSSLAFEVKHIIRKCVSASEDDNSDFHDNLWKYSKCFDHYQDLVDKVIKEVSPFTTYKKSFKLKHYS
ncbi:hypothetical protein G0029_06640 [Acinetobacter sp. YH12138]|uniref:hypothetical protein n=1 Tax=unclassified Acinetobacter TaxID=196816 RepID=UPI0015D3A63F|nr:MULTISPECIES: hypothetical protein [unclassified Acinetobacter]QOW49499.1 hypothetical protein G0029_06640 [Acinetobacter sp. YH12138]